MHTTNEIILMLISSAIITIPFIFLSHLINSFLAKYGYIRPSKDSLLNWVTIWLLILGKQLWLSKLSWAATVVILLLGLIFSYNRYELSQTMEKGRWWWKKSASATMLDKIADK